MPIRIKSDIPEIPAKYDPNKKMDESYISPDEGLELVVNEDSGSEIERRENFALLRYSYDLEYGHFGKTDENISDMLGLKLINHDEKIALGCMAKDFCFERKLKQIYPWDSSAALMVKYEGREMVAFCLFDPASDHFQIDDIYVKLEARGKGLLSLMIADLEEKAKEFGAEGLTLTVQDDNPGAIAKYRQLGFMEEGRVGPDEIRMTKYFGR